MTRQTWISGFYPLMNNRFMVVVGGDNQMVERFNKGDFGLYKGTVNGFEIGTFKLETTPIKEN